MLTVRKAVPVEIDAVVKCDAYTQSRTSRRAFIESAIARGQCSVTVSGDRIAGFVVLNYSFFEQGFVPLIVVAPEYRRAGIGLELLRTVQAECSTDKLFTSTNSSNTAARQLFSEAGLVRSGVIENLDAQDPELGYFKRLR
jgi:ribosomal protein S18 acetylase RimI-like enzyme